MKEKTPKLSLKVLEPLILAQVRNPKRIPCYGSFCAKTAPGSS